MAVGFDLRRRQQHRCERVANGVRHALRHGLRDASVTPTLDNEVPVTLTQAEGRLLTAHARDLGISVSDLLIRIVREAIQRNG